VNAWTATGLVVEASRFEGHTASYGGAIATRGGKVVQDELDEIGKVPTGKAVITSAGELKVGHIIHVNGPKFHEPDQEKKLEKAIESALALARDRGIKQIAFPPIGTGFYQVDLGMCTRKLVELSSKHLEGETSLEEIIFVGLDTREITPFESLLGKGA
jgi:O-acetyl-ADP-ribose deacetylase (regulator of RNase III)